MNKLKNTFVIGFVFGLIVPPLAFILYSILNNPEKTILENLHFYKTGGVLSNVISLSVIANLIPFFGFLNSKNERTAQGVIGGSFIYVFVVLIIILTK